MDDQTRQQQTIASTPVQQQSIPSDQAQQPAQPAAPVSGPHKEIAPLSGKTSEYLIPTESRPELPKEVAAVVEHSPDQDRPQLPQEVMQAGVTHAKETTAHLVDPQGIVQLPTTTQQQALAIEKKASVRDAARWFAEYVLRQFDKIAYQKLPTK